MIEPYLLVAGVDEAGRGPLAGPVVVAAVILDPQRPIAGLADSKTLGAARRERLDKLIRSHAAAFSIVAVDAAEIDARNILQATLIGMARALQALVPAPRHALIDGNRLPRNCPALRRPSSAVMRRRLQSAQHRSWPRSRATGSCSTTSCAFPATDSHDTRAIRRVNIRRAARLGPCPQHRRSFAPVRRLLVSA